ncbi:sigma-70 family RNA polymerase sigma factor [Lentzea tibetensis]|uniref:Sigma-70 family RNA polymerase sigma factor n=1 Tax=Lentzea tibetensis TaxID=2591470 RepID=A0A563EQM5_9PSEU|nr:sigma-70 family RNA polymerase sigma factor [Lentzea tibetensis]TWP49538.1 sigma-70 family RNA polymerase sigma factor [Lentzea tibetensis]
MNTDDFEQHRTHLTAVAQRMLGSRVEAEDAVQEAWLRISTADTSGVDNPAGWLTTVVARVCLNMLRSRETRREEPLETHTPETVEGPEQDAVIADSVGLALLVVLDALSPAERLAFVLHDLFALPFDEIAPVVGKSTAATRQLASRARRRVQGAQPGQQAAKKEIVRAFMDAARGGDMGRLLELLDPDVVLRSDAAAAAMGSEALVVGQRDVAGALCGKAKAVRLALLDSAPGAVWTHRGELKVAFEFTIADGLITGIELVADPEYLAELEVEFLGRTAP